MISTIKSISPTVLLPLFTFIYVYNYSLLSASFHKAVIVTTVVIVLTLYFRFVSIAFRTGIALILAGLVFIGTSWKLGISLKYPIEILYESSFATIPWNNIIVSLSIIASGIFLMLRSLSISKNQSNIDTLLAMLDKKSIEAISQLSELTSNVETTGHTTIVELDDGKKIIKAKLETQLKTYEAAKTEIVEQRESIIQSSANQYNIISLESALQLAGKNIHLAISILEEVIKVDIDNAAHKQLILSDFYFKASRMKDSAEANEKVLQIEPTNTFATSRKAYFDHMKDKPGDTEAQLNEIIKGKLILGHDAGIDYHNYAAYLVNEKRSKEALIYIDKAYDSIKSGDESIDSGAINLTEAAAKLNLAVQTNNNTLFIAAQKLLFKSMTFYDSSYPDSMSMCRSKYEIARLYSFHGAYDLAEIYLVDAIGASISHKSYSYIHIEEAFRLLYPIWQRSDKKCDYIKLLVDHEKIFRNKPDSTELILERGLRMFANLYMMMNRFDLARRLYLESIELQEISGIHDKNQYCSALANFGGYCRKYENDLTSAENYLRNALEARIRYQGEYHFQTAQTRKNLAHLLRTKGIEYFDEARELCQVSLRILTIERGLDNSQVAKWLSDYAMLDSDEGRYWLARIKLEYAYDLYVRLGEIPVMAPPFSIASADVNSPEQQTISFPPIPYGQLHSNLTHKINIVNYLEQWTKTGIHLFHTSTSYTNVEIAEKMGISLVNLEFLSTTPITDCSGQVQPDTYFREHS